MSKPSILLINRVYPPSRGATGRLLQDLACALTQSGWRVTVLTSVEKQPSSLPQNVNYETVKGKAKPKGIFGYSLVWLRLYFKALGLPRHDIVLTMTDPPMLAFAGRLIARSKKSKHVHWCQDLYPDLFKALKLRMPRIIVFWLDKRSVKSLRKCSRIVVIGQCMGKRLQKKHITPNKITFIPNWADLEVIAPSASGHHVEVSDKVKAAAKNPEEMFRDDSPKFRVLYAGTIGRAHPMKVIIEAAEILSKHKEIEFVFVGDQHAHSVLAKERAKRGLENIKFMSFQPIEKYRKVMENGDLHLVTMREEVQGMLVPCKFYSGLTARRPTIFVGPQNCEISMTIKKYKAGAVVSPSDGQALADTIYKYRMDGDLWFAAQEGALQAAQAFHPNQSLQSWLDLLEEVHRS